MKKILVLMLIMITSCTNSTKVIFLGDSITQQAENSEGEGTYKGFITSLRENVSQEVELINKGIGGNKVSDLLLRYDDDADLVEWDEYRFTSMPASFKTSLHHLEIVSLETGL